ncbi:uncharacterized protein LOC102496473 [Tupaia chinensis]|uniref:uncharacterized protein LOC102496473 n=1 Tax=Tupaia chinensis TaxID=246437 RepID=UPI0003C8E57C|nr:uncharacterized protein LOC102496473 [Tupaia chinensis]
MKERGSRRRGGRGVVRGGATCRLPAWRVWTLQPEPSARGCVHPGSRQASRSPRGRSRFCSRTPTPRLGLRGANFAHGQGARPELRDPGPGRELGSAAEGHAGESRGGADGTGAPEKKERQTEAAPRLGEAMTFPLTPAARPAERSRGGAPWRLGGARATSDSAPGPTGTGPSACHKATGLCRHWNALGCSREDERRGPCPYSLPASPGGWALAQSRLGTGIQHGKHWRKDFYSCQGSK